MDMKSLAVAFLLLFVLGGALIFTAEADTRRRVPSPLTLEYSTREFQVYCEAGTGNRLYYAYNVARSGLVVVEGGCN